MLNYVVLTKAVVTIMIVHTVPQTQNVLSFKNISNKISWFL